MKKNEELSIDEMKKISYEIITEELKKADIKENIYPVTFIEYYKDYVFKKPLRLYPEIFFLGNSSLAFHDNEDHDIVIFLHHLKKIKRIEKRVLELVITCYHETRHSIQETYDSYTYEGFLREAEEYIQDASSNKDDSKHYDRYSFEIGAQLYALSKAKEYLKTKYPNLYDKQKIMIDKLENKTQYYYLTYDALDTTERLIQAIRKNNFWPDPNMPLQKEERNQPKESMPIPPAAKLFLDETYQFKDIQEIIQQDTFYKLDERIVKAFLSSKSCLESVQMKNLSTEELGILRSALQYSSTVYQNQIKTIESLYQKGIINGKGIFQTRLSLEEHMAALHSYQEKIANQRKNGLKNERRNHR